MGHPAHFHLFKNVLISLKDEGHEISIFIKKKDILEDLLNECGIPYFNILPDGRKNSAFGMILGVLKQSIMLLSYSIKMKPDILLGSTPSIAHVGWMINKPAINLSEDDAKTIKYFSRITYPFSDVILSPISCDNGKWNSKSLKYDSYHELAYLHPNHFVPSLKCVNKYISMRKPYFIIRFSGLNAYHDSGVSGITAQTALKIIEKLNGAGEIFISSERELPPEFEKYRLNIDLMDMHHLLAYAKLYIGDSQTMAAEAGVLGTPFIRINDFVGKLGYLNELENKYNLGFGLDPKNESDILETIDQILRMDSSIDVWNQRRQLMLAEKIDFSEFLLSYIKKYDTISQGKNADNNSGAAN